MNDLDWLARNVHDKPSNGAKFGEWTYCNGAFIKNSDGYIEWHQVKTRRAELQNKPSWSDAPEWAESLAQWPSGSWEWYDAGIESMHVGPVCNWLGYDKRSSASKGEVLGGWRKTLERRPDRKPSDKTAKALEEANSMNKQWTGPEEGLPPVGATHIADNGTYFKIHVNDSHYVWIESKGKWVFNLWPVTKYYEKSRIKPLRTEEDKAVEEMMNIAEDFRPLSGDEYLLCKDIFKELVRSGYRKLDTPVDND